MNAWRRNPACGKAVAVGRRFTQAFVYYLDVVKDLFVAHRLALKPCLLGLCMPKRNDFRLMKLFDTCGRHPYTHRFDDELDTNSVYRAMILGVVAASLLLTEVANAAVYAAAEAIPSKAKRALTFLLCPCLPAIVQFRYVIQQSQLQLQFTHVLGVYT